MTPATAEQRTAFEQSRATALDSAACLIAAFRLLGVPKSLMDVGCGPGHLVRIAASLAVEAMGVDSYLPGHETGPGYVLLRADLSVSPIKLARRDLVLCLEVAEHLPPEAADTLCDTLAQATGGTLLFSAATPGQGGSGHLNEQPHDYWRAKLEARGLRFDSEATDRIRRIWSEVTLAAWWYSKNLMVFRRPA